MNFGVSYVLSGNTKTANLVSFSYGELADFVAGLLAETEISVVTVLKAS